MTKVANVNRSQGRDHSTRRESLVSDRTWQGSLDECAGDLEPKGEAWGPLLLGLRSRGGRAMMEPARVDADRGGDGKAGYFR